MKKNEMIQKILMQDNVENLVFRLAEQYLESLPKSKVQKIFDTEYEGNEK